MYSKPFDQNYATLVLACIYVCVFVFMCISEFSPYLRNHIRSGLRQSNKNTLSVPFINVKVSVLLKQF